jgi:hypothetical protein
VTDTVDVETLVSGGNVVSGGNAPEVVVNVVDVEDGNIDVWDEGKDDAGVDEVSEEDEAGVDEVRDCEVVVVFENLWNKCALCGPLTFRTRGNS